jgi:hypothetical protein
VKELFDEPGWVDIGIGGKYRTILDTIVDTSPKGRLGIAVFLIAFSMSLLTRFFVWEPNIGYPGWIALLDVAQFIVAGLIYFGYIIYLACDPYGAGGAGVFLMATVIGLLGLGSLTKNDAIISMQISICIILSWVAISLLKKKK